MSAFVVSTKDAAVPILLRQGLDCGYFYKKNKVRTTPSGQYVPDARNNDYNVMDDKFSFVPPLERSSFPMTFQRLKRIQ